MLAVRIAVLLGAAASAAGSETCLRKMAEVCPGLEGKGERCFECIRSHNDVLREYCQGSGSGKTYCGGVSEAAADVEFTFKNSWPVSPPFKSCNVTRGNFEHPAQLSDGTKVAVSGVSAGACVYSFPAFEWYFSWDTAAEKYECHAGKGAPCGDCGSKVVKQSSTAVIFVV
eukprot:TRINITY_DN4081_c0_g1_i1.p3 TRINITY_DN4081_c0_g1~~TRINITY_DN4081_c0_g1_i1.p3  ORF type:complete len:171 (+),score=67.79 TRINITY_DN4081_c0_g1_i1:58-570(+)